MSTQPPGSLFLENGSVVRKTWKAGTLTYTSGGLILLFVYLLFGDFAWSMRDRSVGPMCQWYLSSLNVPNILFGLILSSFPAAIGIVLGPAISVKSDRCRSRWGRRIPFLLVTTPIAALGMIGIAITPLIVEWLHDWHFSRQNEWVVSVVCFTIFWVAFEVATIAGQAVFGGLINDVVPRNLLGRFYGMFRAVSLIDGMIFNYWIMGRVPEHFTIILTVIGIFYGAAFMWVCLRVREGEYAPLPSSNSNSSGILKGLWNGVKSYARECYAHPYYLSVYFFLMLSLLAFSPINIFALPYAKSLGIDMETYGKFLALTYMISLSLSFFLGWLADLFHPLRMSLVSLACYVLVASWGSIFAITQETFLIAWVLHGIFSGCFMTASASMGQRLFPREKYAQFASAAYTLNSLALMVIGPLVGLVVDQTGNVYQSTFVWALLLGLVGLIVGFFVHRGFIKCGGIKDYAAP